MTASHQNIVQVDGINLYVSSWKSCATSRGSVLAVHGFGSDGFRSFSRLANKLVVDGYDCVAPDLPGFGKSERMDKYSLKHYAQILVAVVDSMHQPVLVAGHSMGAKVALAMCVDFPEMVNGFALINPGGFSRYAPWLRRVGDSPSLVNLLRLNTVRRLLSKTPAGPLVNSPNFRKTVTDFVGSNSSLDLKRTGYWSKLPDIATRGMLIWGVNDSILPDDVPSHVSNTMTDLQTAYIENAGHAPMIDQPEHVAKHMVQFLEDLR